ncbi:GbsR/MarR family transcriptional regulator [Streptomyces iconiensis]|uniref:Helix-turn-helix domain-containing protein n=1 Tax=Streptomyces iconiensis TaxID=1384038 RepID=A0ABT7A653_9ACTN|nr:helix-turn-helix domain-containing protein [Streptomyces iconiensis]MDJ1136823.1 helix-turn-helix domain-containing protein [Streptomyces iconiensis]
MPHAPHNGEAADNSQLIDDFGLRIGRAMGWPPMAGRLAGILMLSPAPMTLSELQQALGASKGSASEMTRLLMTHGTVDRIKLPGVRQAVYEWRDDAWVGCLQYQLDQTTQLLDLARTAHDRGSHLPSAQQTRLLDMRTFYEFMVEQLRQLLGDYKRQLRTHDSR